MEDERRRLASAWAAAANQSNFASGTEIDSVDSTLPINQSINQSMVNDEDNERVTARRR